MFVHILFPRAHKKILFFDETGFYNDKFIQFI